MTHQELKKVIDFYNQVILQQIIKPLEITEIYKLVCPECDSYINYKVKQRAIAVYVQNLQKEVIKEMEDFFKGIDKTETAAPVPMTEQSHSESNTPNSVLDDDNDTMDAINEMNEIEEEIRIISFNNDEQTVTVDGVTHDLKDKDKGEDLSEIIKPKRTRKPNKKK